MSTEDAAGREAAQPLPEPQTYVGDFVPAWADPWGDRDEPFPETYYTADEAEAVLAEERYLHLHHPERLYAPGFEHLVIDDGDTR